MAVPKAFITDTELELLKVLWNEQPLTARGHAHLERPLDVGVRTVR